MVFNDAFNNVSVISWQSVLLVEKTINLPQVTDKLSTSVVISTDCIDSCKSSYHVITTKTDPLDSRNTIFNIIKSHMT
jgi:hypothetical protein